MKMQWPKEMCRLLRYNRIRKEINQCQDVIKQDHPQEPEALVTAAAPATPASLAQAQAPKPVDKRGRASKTLAQEKIISQEINTYNLARDCPH